MMSKPKRGGRTTDPTTIQPSDIIRRAKDATRAQAEALKNPAVEPGTRRTDVKIGICRGCGRQKQVSKLSGVCSRCWLVQVEAEMEVLEAETMRETAAISSHRDGRGAVLDAYREAEKQLRESQKQLP